MWLLTTTGFFSIVCKPGDETSDMLTIRSRVRSDLEDLRQYLPALGEIDEGLGTDYRYRARAKRAEIKNALAKMIDNINYENFKNEIVKKQGKERASFYSQVWEVLYGMQSTSADLFGQAYGGILVHPDGRILLRRPTDDFDGYVWTFPKGRPDPWDKPEDAALREVKEETGFSAKILRKLPGTFKGTTSVTEYFIMSPIGDPGDFDFAETSEVRWVGLDEAAELIPQTTNQIGRERDLAVLQALRITLKHLGS